MGVVFRARQVTLDRWVALKLLARTAASGSTFAERFIREARAAAQLVHPNIIQIYTIGEHKGAPYYAMEYVDGEDLAHVIRESGKLNYDETMEVARSVAKALALAGSRGIVHRDIKPANVMVANTGLVKVMDFGLAKAASSDHTLTHQGQIMGTPTYMSPEQGMSKEVDTRSDLYSLGCVIYESLTGLPPFQADNVAAYVFKHTFEPVTPPSKLNASVSAGLETICLKLLAKKPEERYQNAAELLAALAALPANAALAEISLANRAVAVKATQAARVKAGTNQPAAKTPEEKGAQTPAAQSASRSSRRVVENTLVAAEYQTPLPKTPTPADTAIMGGQQAPAVPPSASGRLPDNTLVHEEYQTPSPLTPPPVDLPQAPSQRAPSLRSMPIAPFAKESTRAKIVSSSRYASVFAPAVSPPEDLEVPPAPPPQADLEVPPAPSPQTSFATPALGTARKSSYASKAISSYFQKLTDGRWGYDTSQGRCKYAEGLASEALPGANLKLGEWGDCLVCSLWSRRHGCSLAAVQHIERTSRAKGVDLLEEAAGVWCAAGRFDLATGAIEEHLKAHSEEPEGYRALAHIYERPDYPGKDRGRVIVLYQRFIELAPLSPRISPLEIQRARERLAAMQAGKAGWAGDAVHQSGAFPGVLQSFRCFHRYGSQVYFAYGALSREQVVLAKAGEVCPDTGITAAEMSHSLLRATTIFRRMKSERAKTEEREAVKKEVERLSLTPPEALSKESGRAFSLAVKDIKAVEYKKDAEQHLVKILSQGQLHELIFSAPTAAEAERCAVILKRLTGK